MATKLSDREMDVMLVLASGALNQQIAKHLHLTEKTVKNHMTRIYEKLDVDSRLCAVLVAIQRGDIDPYALLIVRKSQPHPIYG